MERPMRLHTAIDGCPDVTPWLTDLHTGLPARAAVLDIGCGCGWAVFALSALTTSLVRRLNADRSTVALLADLSYIGYPSQLA